MGRKNLNTPPPGYTYNEASIRRGRGGRITKIMPTINPTSSINNRPYDINATNVSILIPAFNCVDFIEGCLDSIKNQSKNDDSGPANAPNSKPSGLPNTSTDEGFQRQKW